MRPSRVPFDDQTCHRACDDRDARFDGVFFVAISSTGIFCRPICPSRRARPDRRRFFSSPADARDAGYRPCLRCRPDLAPGDAPVDAVARLARLAAARIADGALDGRTVKSLASGLGIGERQLRRALHAAHGKSPRELAIAARLQRARRLLAETASPVARIAFASGFQSLRRFNAAFRARFRMSPRDARTTALTMALATALTMAPSRAAAQATPPQSAAPAPHDALHGAAVRLAPADLERVRRATARYANVDSARAAGYAPIQARCIASESEGGMGFHAVNRAFLNDSLAIDRPAYLVFERAADGTMALTAVEYAVPYARRPRDSEPPTLFGQQMLRSDPLAIWYLHVWAHRENPGGDVADYNPRVVCPP